MSNVISFPVTTAPVDRATTLSALIEGVATRRCLPDDVFWLKENAELLGVLAATAPDLAPEALAPYADFYDRIEDKLKFYPQYYRFFLSICLDLEDLGMAGQKGEALCHWAARSALAQAELSDLQRAEAQRLLARRGAAHPSPADGLGSRLRDFTERAATFALPNKKAAYELTHIVFYLSEYGRRDPELSQAALTSLEFAGVLAYLDQNLDLLAEVCTALRFAGVTPSPVWTRAVARGHGGVRLAAGDRAQGAADAYHLYLVTGWALMVEGQGGFDQSVPTGGTLHFAASEMPGGALRSLSETLFGLGAGRSANWNGMRGRVISCLTQENRDVLQAAEASTDKFDAFFAGFARATGIGTLQAG